MNSDLKYVIYSHSDFLDVLIIACDYLDKIPKSDKILLINNSDGEDMYKIYSTFSNVIFYDDTLYYTDKIAKILDQIDSEYILFTHEVDIILDIDTTLMNQFVKYMKINNIDRIDMQPNGGNDGNYVKIEKNRDVSEWALFNNILDPQHQLTDSDWYLSNHVDTNSYVFNVNPSIWKKSSYKELFENFKGRTYRNIEYGDIQEYCVKYKILNLYSRNVLRCGYLKCLPFYKYLHITHYQRLLRFDGTFKDEFGQSYHDAAKEYVDIVIKYNLKNSKRAFS